MKKSDKKVRNYSYNQVDINKGMDNFKKDRQKIIRNFPKNCSENYYLNNLDSLKKEFFIKNINKKQFFTINELFKIISYKKKYKTFKKSDNKLINFLQKKFETKRKIDEVYVKEIKRKITNIKQNRIDTLSLLSYILMLKFDFEKNFSYLSTSLKISDFIGDNFKKDQINASPLAILMYLSESRLIEKTLKDF